MSFFLLLHFVVCFWFFVFVGFLVCFFFLPPTQGNISVFLPVLSFCAQPTPEWNSKICWLSGMYLLCFSCHIEMCLCPGVCWHVLSVHWIMNSLYFPTNLCNSRDSKTLARNAHNNKQICITYTSEHLPHSTCMETLLHISHTGLHLNFLVSSVTPPLVGLWCWALVGGEGAGAASALLPMKVCPTGDAGLCPCSWPFLGQLCPCASAAALLTVLSIIQMDYEAHILLAQLAKGNVTSPCSLAEILKHFHHIILPTLLIDNNFLLYIFFY